MTRVLLLLTLLAGCTPPASVDDPALTTAEAGAAVEERADWESAFLAEGTVGTFVLYDPATDETQRYNPSRAAVRFTPASTSKVFNALVFLDQGVVTDPDSVFAWDGRVRDIAAWNRDHSLRTGMEVSAVWLFQRLAGEVGRDGYAEVFARQPYGNSTLSDSLEMSWLDDTWQVSADEQVAFVDGLRRGTLGFSSDDQATVRDLVPVLAEAGGQRLKAKTGWGGYDHADGERVSIGWIVGWVEGPNGDRVFAMNAEAAPGRTFDIGPGRLRIVRAILEAEGLLTPEADERP